MQFSHDSIHFRPASATNKSSKFHQSLRENKSTSAQRGTGIVYPEILLRSQPAAGTAGYACLLLISRLRMIHLPKNPNSDRPHHCPGAASNRKFGKQKTPTNGRSVIFHVMIISIRHLCKPANCLSTLEVQFHTQS